MTTTGKRALRSAARHRRSGTDAAARAADSVRWRDQVLTLEPVQDAEVVAAYASYGTEPPTGELVAALRARGVRVLLPVLLADRDLGWVEAGAEPAPDREPDREAITAADVVLVPALLVARDGARLGQGGGSYDRALTRVRPGVPVVALVHDDELLDAGALPREPHDRPVTHAATPTRLVRLDAPDTD